MKRKLLIITLLSGLLSSAFGQTATPDTQEISLEWLFQRAEENNESLEAMALKLEADSLRILSMRGGLFPQISANADLTLLDQVPNTKQALIGDGPLDILLTGGVSQKIWDGGRTRAEMNYMSAGREVSRQNLEILEQAVKARIAEAYYNLVGLQKGIDVIDENLSMLDERIRFVDLLIDAGRASETDRGRWEVAKSQLEGKRLQAEYSYESMSRTIGTLIGLNTPVYFIPGDVVEQVPENDVSTISADSAPVVGKQTALIEQAEADIRRSKTARMPSLTARAWYGWEFADAGFSPTENERWFGGLFASVPIFDGMTTRKKIDASRVSADIAQIDLERTLRETDAAIRNFTEQLEVLRQRFLIEENASAQAEENLRLGLVEYEAGRRSNMDIIDMQNSLLQTQLSANSILIEYYIAKARLDALAGNL